MVGGREGRCGVVVCFLFFSFLFYLLLRDLYEV